MKIKDVEKETGIGVHSIRFYEEMGLLKIQRDPENRYRDFSAQDIKKLKEIKLFRGLGISMEEIRRYYDKEITLEELMDHQLKELHEQHSDMKLKEQLCADIKESNSPLLSYTVDQYEEVIQHQREKTPYKDAGSLLSSWNQAEDDRKNSRMMIFLAIPMILFSAALVSVIIQDVLETSSHSLSSAVWTILIISIFVVIILLYFYFYHSILIEEMYEFKEYGLYYISKEKVKNTKIRHTWSRKKLISLMDYVSYDNIEVLKVWFHLVAKTPLNGANIYQTDFYVYTSDDEMIHINTGIFGVTDEKIKLTIELLREHAKKVIDPFHIIEHLDDEREQFQIYLDTIYSKKERRRVNGIQR